MPLLVRARKADRINSGTAAVGPFGSLFSPSESVRLPARRYLRRSRFSPMGSQTPKFWVEISALDHGHGGRGWELGTCLWSPTTDRLGHDRYRLMRAPLKGDVVYHLIRRDEQRALVGRSRVFSSASVVSQLPPEPGAWAHFQSFFRIPLEHFEQFETPIPLSQIEILHLDAIRNDIVPLRPAQDRKS